MPYFKVLEYFIVYNYENQYILINYAIFVY